MIICRISTGLDSAEIVEQFTGRARKSHRGDGFMDVSWSELVRLEPRLKTLLQHAKSYQGGEGFCANKVWYGGDFLALRERMSRLVGWDRKTGYFILGTSEAYDIAYDKLYSALPDCQHEGLC